MNESSSQPRATGLAIPRLYKATVQSAMSVERPLAERATAAMIVSKWELDKAPRNRAPWPEELLAILVLQRLQGEAQSYGERLLERILDGHTQAVAEGFRAALKPGGAPDEGIQVSADPGPKELTGEVDGSRVAGVDRLDAPPPVEDEDYPFESPPVEDEDYEVPKPRDAEDKDMVNLAEDERKDPTTEEGPQAGDAKDGFHLVEEQAAGLRRILSDIKKRRKEVRLSGSAGSGKSTLMRTLTRELRDRGIPYVLLGPTNQAARRLAHLTEGEAGTIHQLIYGAPEETPTGELIFPPARLPTDTDGNPLVDPSGVYVVDESSMVGSTLANDLRGLIHGTIVWVGDAGQLPPVGEPPGVDLAHAEVILQQIHRQAESSPVLAMATAVRKIEWEDKRPRVWDLTKKFKVPFVSGGTGLVASNLLHLHQHGRPDAVALTWMNKTRHAVNRRYRGLCGATNPLHVGERLVVCANHYGRRLLNGDVLKVVSIRWDPIPDWFGGCLGSVLATVMVEGQKEPIYTTDTLLAIQIDETGPMKGKTERKIWMEALATARSTIETVLTKDSERMLLFGRTLSNILLLDYAYCMTVHRFQGSQASAILVAWTQDAMWNGTKKDTEAGRRKWFKETRCWLYTAMTRTSDYLQIISVPFEA